MGIHTITHAVIFYMTIACLCYFFLEILDHNGGDNFPLSLFWFLGIPLLLIGALFAIVGMCAARVRMKIEDYLYGRDVK